MHTSNRDAGTAIVDQYLDDRGLTGLSTLLGGGRKWFLPNSTDTTSPQAALIGASLHSHNALTGTQSTGATTGQRDN